MTLSLVVARAENGVIGRASGLPWRLPADLRHFKRLTTGHTVIFGRKTYEAVGRPLPNRRIIVVTRDPSYRPEGVEVAQSLEDALTLAGADNEVFVGGGEQIYRLALPSASRVYLTQVHAAVPGDTYFPALDESEWRLCAEDRHEADDRNPLAHSFQTWERRSGGE